MIASTTSAQNRTVYSLEMLFYLIHLVFPLFLLFFILSIVWWYATIPSNLPHGPRGLPFIGSLLTTFKATTLPTKLLQWTKQYGPLYKFYVGDKLVIVLGNWEVMHEALVNQGDIYAGRPVVHSVVPEEMIGKSKKHPHFGECEWCLY